MIYTDGVHLITDGDILELHIFAKGIGLKRAWFQDKRHKHYDLTTPRMVNRAIKAGAQKATSRQIIKILKEGKEK